MEKMQVNKFTSLLNKKTLTDQIKTIEVPKWNMKVLLLYNIYIKNSEEESKSILKDLSFCVSGFQKVGIIGASGAGKSTLIDVLSGFSLPTSGSITVNERVTGKFRYSWLARADHLYPATSLYLFGYCCRKY